MQNSKQNSKQIADDSHSVQDKKELKLDKEVIEMAKILRKIKKSANSLVFLKRQTQETIVFGIEPSANTIEKSIQSLKEIDNIDQNALPLLSEIEQRLKTSQMSMSKMTSSGDLANKKVFNEKGLGYDAEPNI